MADVFISYKSERRPAISHLARVIENHGYTVWFDYALMSGGSFSSQIERELRAARAVIVVWCSLSTRTVEGKTNWVVEEADLAKQLGTYLPIWIEPVDLPLGFRMGEVTDIADWNGDPRSHDIDRLIEQLSLKVGRDPDVNYKALVAQSADVRRTGLTNLAAYPLDKKGAQLAARNREREQRKKEEAERIEEIAREEEAARLAAEKALADAKARLEAEQRLKREHEAAKAEQARLQQLAEEERQRQALEEAVAQQREEQRLKDEAEAACKAEEDRLEAERLERERLEKAQRLQEEAERQREAARAARELDEAARTAARAERQRQTDERIGGFRAFFAEHRYTLIGLGATVGVSALILTIAQLTSPIPQKAFEDAGAGADSAFATPMPAAADPTPARDPAESLVGTWTLESIPCARANAGNGQQLLERAPSGEWSVNGTQVEGTDTPDKNGWFKIDGLYWRVLGEQLQLSVEGGDDSSATVLNRCKA